MAQDWNEQVIGWMKRKFQWVSNPTTAETLPAFTAVVRAKDMGFEAIKLESDNILVITTSLAQLPVDKS